MSLKSDLWTEKDTNSHHLQLFMYQDWNKQKVPVKENCEYGYATTGGSQVWQPTLQSQLVSHSPYRYGEIPIIHLIGQETEKFSKIYLHMGIINLMYNIQI